MNLGQSIDQETLRPRESGIPGAFGAAVRETLGRIPAPETPWWKRPDAGGAERWRLKPHTAKSEVVRAIERAGRALTIHQLRAALPAVSGGSVKQALFDLQASGMIVKHGECKSYRYGLPR